MLNRVQCRFVTRPGWILLLSASMLSAVPWAPTIIGRRADASGLHGPDQSQQFQPQSESFAICPGGSCSTILNCRTHTNGAQQNYDCNWRWSV